MTSQERAQVSAQWALIAAMHGKDLSRPMLIMMLDAIDDLPADAVLFALKTWTKTSKQSRHPMPAELRELACPEVSPENVAREAAARIPEAIKLYGYNDPVRARAHIGDLGWGVVKRSGGWEHVCQYHGTPEMNALTFHAQARDLARSHIEFAETGTLGEAPGLPAPKESVGLTKIGNLLQMIPRPDGER